MSNRPDPARTGELCAHLALAFPTLRPALAARAVLAAQRAALAAKRLEEWRCGHDEPEADQARREKRQARTIAKLAQAFADAGAPGVTVRLGGDPRGPCGWLKIPGQDGDGWDRGAGFPLY